MNPGRWMVLFGGIAIGASVAGLVAMKSSPVSPSVASSPSKEQGSSGGTSTEVRTNYVVPTDPRISALEARLAELERADSGAAAPRAAETPRPTRTPAEERAHLVERRDSWMENYRTEGVDPSWAPRVQSSLSKGIASAAAEAPTVRVEKVECKTTSCMASLSWPSYQDALNHYGAFQKSADGLRCATAFVLAPPDDPSAPYSALLMFDCEAERTAQ